MMATQDLLNMFAAAAHLKAFASDFIDVQVVLIEIPNRKILSLFSGYYKTYVHNYIL